MEELTLNYLYTKYMKNQIARIHIDFTIAKVKEEKYSGYKNTTLTIENEEKRRAKITEIFNLGERPLYKIIQILYTCETNIRNFILESLPEKYADWRIDRINVHDVSIRDRVLAVAYIYHRSYHQQKTIRTTLIELEIKDEKINTPLNLETFWNIIEEKPNTNCNGKEFESDEEIYEELETINWFNFNESLTYQDYNFRKENLKSTK